MLESTGSGSDCTHNMFSTAKDPSLSVILSLTDRQTAVFMSGQPAVILTPGNSEGGKERLGFADSGYVARYIQKHSLFAALLSECCNHI